MSIFQSRSKSKSRTTPYDPGQLREITQRIGELGRTPMEMYPEQMYAELTPQQEQALQMREAFAGDIQGGMVDPAMAAWQSMLTAPDVAANPYVQGMLEQQADIAGRSFRESLPETRSAAIAAGQLGGSRQGVVEAMRERGLREALAQSAAQTQLGAYQQGLGQQRAGISAAPGMAQFGMAPADILSGVGQARRAEDQMAINEAVQRFNFAQQEPWQRTQNQLNMFNAATLPYAATESRSTSRQSPFSSAMQLGSLAMGGFNAFGGGGGGGGAAPMPQPAMMPQQSMYGMGMMPQNFMSPRQMFPGAYG